MHYEENRWLQRFQNYQRALYHLDDAKELGVENMKPLEIQGFIKGFELAYELGWKVMKDYLEEQGESGFPGSLAVIKAAFKAGLIDNGNQWVKMKESRDEAAHTYDEAVALELARKISDEYYEVFDALDKKFTAIKNDLD